jgi:hypothetical protein
MSESYQIVPPPGSSAPLDPKRIADLLANLLEPAYVRRGREVHVAQSASQNRGNLVSSDIHVPSTSPVDVLQR